MEPEAFPLCLFCSDLIKFQENSEDVNRQLPHHSTFDLLTSSSKTCHLCHKITTLWNISSLGPKYARLTAAAGESSNVFNSEEAWSVAIRLLGSQRMLSGVHWKFVQVDFSNDNIALSLLANLTLVTCSSVDVISTQPAWKAPSTSVEDKLLAIQTWFNDCRSGSTGKHRGCQPIPFTPLRLVDVGLGSAPPRLVQPSPDQRVEYTALSHCWGDSLPTKTTKDTLSEFSHKLPLAHLPKNFSNAIRITKELGIACIWIDALCIVQDDDEEWQSEAARMDSVYLGSQLTIAAAQSSDTFGGCFPSWDEELQKGHMFFKTPGNGDEHLLVRVYPSDVRNRSEDTPLSRRGWTLQEQLLSHRMAWCMQPEVHWRCQAGSRSQSGLFFVVPDDMAPAQSILPLMRASSPLITTDWRRIADNYSHRKFTFPQDRVPAIAGITRYFAGQIQDEPILGLWAKTFSRDLAWLRSSPDLQPELSSLATSLPSWSWLSCPGSIHYDPWDWTLRPNSSSASDPVDHVKLLEWHVGWDGKPYTSAVTSAYARVNGPVAEILIRPFPEGSWSNPPYFQIFGEDLKFGDADGAQKRIPWRCCGQFDSANASETEHKRTFLCLLLRSRMGVRLKGRAHLEEVFLMLDVVGDVEEGKYRRVGLARIMSDEVSLRSFDLHERMDLLLV